MQVAKRLLRRSRDFADVASGEVIGPERARSALDELEIDPIDLDARARAILKEFALLQKVCQKRISRPRLPLPKTDSPTAPSPRTRWQSGPASIPEAAEPTRRG